MSTESIQSESTRTSRRRVLEIILIAVAFAALATGCQWLLMSEHSPLNHGERPDTTGWLILTLPAFYLFIALFGIHGGETDYFICVLVQWFILGVPVGILVSAVRRALKWT